MPRQPRYFLPDYPQHLVIRGVNKGDTFFAPYDYGLFKRVLRSFAEKYGCAIHAYVLMTNHVHLLVTPSQQRSIPLVMQAIGRSYVQAINRNYGRTGTLWQGRYKSCLVHDDQYLLACQRYIELNPVRAGMVGNAGDYPYSSYRCNALGQADPLVVPHRTYLELGRNRREQLGNYRRQFDKEQDTATLSAIRDATDSCLVLGTEEFKDQIEVILGRSVRPAKMGRPGKSDQSEKCGSTLLLNFED